MSEPQTDAAAPPAAAPRKRRSKLLTLGLPALVLILGGGGAGWWFMQTPTEAAVPAVDPEPTGLLPFDGLIVNLADPGGRRFLRLSMILLLPDAHEAKELSENELVMSRVRSALIDLLSTRTSASLGTPEGRAELKKAIADAAHHTGHMEVRDVLFKEFVVQ